tara:strand:+ start:5471 stop:5764 length:294 start_codon:yes stop_codon:yes gene_type:complete
MTQQELIEIIQQHHPNAREVAIRKALNRAQDDLTAKTGIIYAIATDTLNTDASGAELKNKRFYDLDPGMLEIKKVEVGNITIKKLINPPIEGDEDLL